MDLLNLSVTPEQLAIVTFFCVGFVKLVDELFSKDWKGAAKIAGSTVVGALIALGIDHVTVLAGAAIGLSASGLVTGLTFFGKQSAAPAADAAAVPDAMPIREG